MGKFRVRTKNAKRGARWAKGQSSSSNPSRSNFRDAAKSRLGSALGGGRSVSPAAGPNRLTAESLLRHDVLMGDITEAATGAGGDQDETLTLGQTHKTFETFASDWTQCSNVSFNKIIKRFNGNNAHHKEMLAILAAVAEVIKSSGGEESSTEYFAALLTTLEATDTQEGLSATLTLLSMVIKTVPQEVLQAQFGNVSKLLLDNLSVHGTAIAENTSVVRALIGCLSVLLRAQSAFTWTQGSTMQVYKALLSFSAHPKPKIRKAGQHAVCSILKGSLILTTDDAPEFHPAAATTIKDCLEKLNLSEEPNTVLHTFLLLKEILGCAPQNSVKNVCDATLGLMQSKLHPHVNSCGMQMLFGLFASRPSERTLSADMNAKLITALYDFKPSVNDRGPIIAWLTVQQEALVNLASLSPNICLAHLPNFFGEAKKCWMSDRHEVAVAAMTALKAVCNECLLPNMPQFSTDKDSIEKLQKIFNHIKDGLGYQYHGAWAQVLHLMAVVFDVAGAHCPKLLSKFLPLLSECRNAQNFAFTNELDYVVGKAIRRMGPKTVLAAIDLQITGDETNYDFPRSWLLPVLRENIQNTELSFFVEYFQPLAEKCRHRSNKCLSVDDRIGHKMYQMLDYQIWSLLPGFCNNPTDLKESFKLIARTMGQQLEVRKDLRIDILSSLRQLILKNLENEENRQVLSDFAKNYLPILCNIYTVQPVGSEETGQRLAVFETIKQYARIAPEDRLHMMFDKAFEVYLTGSGFIKEATLDVLRAYLPYQDASRIHKLYQVIVKQLGSKDHKEQKKSYRFLEDLCNADSQSCNEFLSRLLDVKRSDNLQKVFLNSLSKASPSSQASRIRCLIHIVRQLSGEEEEHQKFVKSIIPEAILCIKAVNEKARAGAYTLLVVIGETLIKWNAEEDEALLGYVETLSAGLAGEPTLVHCTLLAVTRIFYEFQDIMPDSLRDFLVGNVCHLLTSSSREAVGSSLSFLRVFVQVNPVFKTGKQEILEKIVTSIMNMTEDCKRHFRLKTRYLLDRLVRKFGYDMVAALVPKSDETMMKRLKNLRKAQSRKQKLEETKVRHGNDDSDDEEDVFHVRAKPKTMEEILAESSDSEIDQDDAKTNRKEANLKKRKGKKDKMQLQKSSFISEKNEEDIIDFLDPSAAQQVTSLKPRSSKEKAADGGVAGRQKMKNGGFAIGADGRLIIKDDDEEGSSDDEQKPKGKKYMMDDSDDEETNENNFKSLVSTSAARKRKFGGSVASSRRTNVSESSMKYQAGGSGIHRPLGGKKENTSKTPTEYGSEYRAKKARGDVKKKGKPDPYAYVPLQKSSLNRRKKAKFEGQFNNLVKAAKQGAKSGSKAKSNLATKMKSMKV